MTWISIFQSMMMMKKVIPGANNNKISIFWTINKNKAKHPKAQDQSISLQQKVQIK